jgi:hypothetical protein
MLTSDLTEHNSVLGKVVAWWRDRRSRQVELSRLEASGEMTAIAQDAGLSTYDLRRLVGEGPNAGELQDRMAVLGLDPASLSRDEPAVARDLQRTCSFCASKRQCRHDLAARPADPRWQDYCPNASTLNTLKGPS